ncbi:MAG: cyclic pyranopterin monophosphate synthase MoaC [Aquificaceae bacterium]
MRTVDISSKPVTLRTAKAYGRIKLKSDTVRAILDGKVPKGDVLQACKLSGVFGAKKTSEILPFCHPISFDHVEVEVKLSKDTLEVFAFVKGIGRTGYEMEALTSVCSSLLTVYDMCKGMDDSMVIEDIRLVEKSGGRSQWAKDLKGKKVLVYSDEDAYSLIVEYLMPLEPSKLEVRRSVEDKFDLIITTESLDFEEDFVGLETVVNQKLFELFPSSLKRGVRVGRDKMGCTVIVLEPSREIIRAFFENFSYLLGTWVDESK